MTYPGAYLRLCSTAQEARYGAIQSTVQIRKFPTLVRPDESEKNTSILSVVNQMRKGNKPGFVMTIGCVINHSH